MPMVPPNFCCRRADAACAPPCPAPAIRTSKQTIGAASILGSDLDSESTEISVADYLTGKSGTLVTMVRPIEQIFFIWGYRREAGGELRIHINVAGGARAAAAALSNQLVQTAVADDLH
jgi:hypothetical protein